MGVMICAMVICFISMATQRCMRLVSRVTPQWQSCFSDTGLVINVETRYVFTLLARVVFFVCARSLCVLELCICVHSVVGVAQLKFMC